MSDDSTFSARSLLKLAGVVFVPALAAGLVAGFIALEHNPLNEYRTDTGLLTTEWYGLVGSYLVVLGVPCFAVGLFLLWASRHREG